MTARWNLFEVLADILGRLDAIDTKLGAIMTTQDDLNAEATEIETDVTSLNATTQAVKDEIAALQAANPGLDLTSLNAAVADLDAATASAQQNVPPSS